MGSAAVGARRLANDVHAPLKRGRTEIEARYCAYPAGDPRGGSSKERSAQAGAGRDDPSTRCFRLTARPACDDAAGEHNVGG